MSAYRFPRPAPHRGQGAKQPEKSRENLENRKEKPLQTEDGDAVLDPYLQPGIKPVLEMLAADPAKIDAVFLRKGRKGKETDKIIDLCREMGVRYSLVDDAALDRLWRGRHQGVIARLFGTGFTELPDLLDRAADDPLPLILALDQVQDPGNAGTLARTLYALGGTGFIIPKHNGVYLGAAAARVSAGALDKLAVAKVANLAQALDAAIEAGFSVYGADSAKPEAGVESENAFTFTPRLPAILVLGSEEGGIRPIIRKRCTALVSIPFAREFDSLNVAQAGGIIISAFAASRGK
ncbi:RNA methyltransferase [Desulfovibrio sp. OttesenSCG-928-O18]|nr:RNA methyltransferase [Desulfovibrio sp. OttesenSCG-928-O18]